jgi:hypothetical protein
MPNILDETMDDNLTAGIPDDLNWGGGGSNPFSGVTAGGALKGLGSVFGAIGDFQEGTAYSTAAKEAFHNQYLSTLQGKIEQSQSQRQVNLVSGQEASSYTGNGLALQGSASAVMRNTAQQGALQHAIIGMKAGAQSEGYLEQGDQFKKMAQAADIAGVGGLINGVASFFGG